MNRALIKTVLTVLVAVCVFDPADKILGLKVPLFAAAWALFLSGAIVSSGSLKVSKNVIAYLAVFLAIPVISIVYYFATGTDFVNYDGFQYLKSYLFVTLVVILYAEKIDLTLSVVATLTVMSFISIALLVIGYADYSLVMSFYEKFAIPYGICSIGTRDFARFILPDMPQIFFHTATLLVIPVAYFTMKLLHSTGGARMVYALLAAVNIVAMFFGGTKSNIVFSLLTPVVVAYWYSKRKKLIFCCVIAILAVLYIKFWSAIKVSVFNPEESSNFYKLSFLGDYRVLFSNTSVLWFGEGLGSYFNTTLRGYVSLTEFTYLEFIRRFGLLLGVPSLALIFYPLSRLNCKECRELHYLLLAYLCYLVMSFTNPLLMSSSGMLLLAVVLHKVFSSRSFSGGAAYARL